MSRLEDKFCRLMTRNRFVTETELPSIISYQSISDIRPSKDTNIAPNTSRTDTTSTTPQTNSDISTRSCGRVSFSSYSAGHPDDYRSPVESRLGSIVDASEIFMGDISDLKAIAHRMIRANHGPELMRAFVTSCSEIVSNDFVLIGFHELAKEEAQTLPWDALSREMKNWVRAAKVTFQIILPRKRWLCDEVFGTYMHGAVFDEAAKSTVMRLIKFTKAASHSKGSAKIIFHLLSMYEALIDALAGTHRLFADSPDKFICGEIERAVHELRNAVLGILPVWLEDLAQKDLSHTAEGNKEGTHPVTRYAISYILVLVANHRHSLNFLLHDELVIGQSEISPLGHMVLELLSNLNSVLEHKSTNMGPGVREIFLINNLRYLLDSVTDSELKGQLIDSWSKELQERIDELLSRYLRSSWDDVLSPLSDKNLPQRKGMKMFVSIYKTALRRKLKRFNSAFEAACNLQSSWKVPDPKLRQEIRMAISHTVIPVYDSFLHRLESFGERHHLDLEMYTTKALEGRIFGLFEGS